MNLTVNTVMVIALYISKIWAGGDCKLAIILSLSYPATMLLQFQNSPVSLFMAILFSFVFGYIMLLALYIKNGWIKKDFGSKIIKENIFKFLYNYIVIYIWLAFIQRILIMVPYLNSVPWWSWMLLSIGTAIIIQRYSFFKNPFLLGTAFALLIYLYIPNLSLLVSWPQVLLVLLFSLLKMGMSTITYETIPTTAVEKGMIISTGSSVLFTGSRVKGLPGISDESLKSRLTQDEAESIVRWASSKKGRPEITIVKKIPYAFCIIAGFITYFLIWGYLS